MNQLTISYMMDLSRNAVPNKEFLKKFIDYLSLMGYNELQLYMEDTYKIDSEPYFGYFRGPLDSEFIKEIDAYAQSKGIRLVPAIEVLGHLAKLFRWYRFMPIQDLSDVLLEGSDETYELIDKMFESLSKSFSSKIINIGMDETYACGRGQHLNLHGFEPHKDIFLRHLNKVAEIAEKYGFKPIMWGDMFIANENNNHYFSKNPKLSKETIQLKPKSITPVYWDYYNVDEELISGLIKAFKKLDKNFVYAGGNWSWRGFAPRNDTANKVHSKIIPLAKEAGCKYFMNTSWGDDGNECPELSTLPSTFVFAEYVKGNFDLENIKAKFFELFGISFDDYISLDNLNNLGNNLEKAQLMKHNPAKYMLYSDCLGSPLDATVDVSKTVKITNAKKTYKKYVKNKDFGYVFELEYQLAKVLELKYPFGVKLREAYLKKDTKNLKKCLQNLNKIEKEVGKLIKTVRAYWLKENSLFGYEVQDMRLGGLLQRIRSSKVILSDYLKGKISSIETLEVPLEKYNGVDFKEEVSEQTHLKCISTAYTSFIG